MRNDLDAERDEIVGKSQVAELDPGRLGIVQQGEAFLVRDGKVKNKVRRHPRLGRPVCGRLLEVPGLAEDMRNTEDHGISQCVSLIAPAIVLSPGKDLIWYQNQGLQGNV